MQPTIVLRLLGSASLFALLASAQSENKNPAADDPRIQKQPPFHWGTPPPNHRVKIGFVPIRVLASVRHERTTKHVPREEALAEASTPEEIILAKRLKEAITTKKLGEVYTEQGYEDQKYDHGHFEKQGKFKENFKNHDKAEHRAPHHNYEGAASSPSADQAPLQTIVRPKKMISAADAPPSDAPINIKKYPFYFTAAKNSPQRYATNPALLPDKKNNPDMPFYASTNYKECPDISPVLSVGPDDKNPKGEPRLRGLGDKIDCLVSSYFGSDPFDNPFFKEEKVHAANINPKYLLPSESNNGPVTFITNATFMEMAQNEARTRKTRKSKNKKSPKEQPKYYPNHRQIAAASTENIEGMLPPPLPLRVRKVRDLGATSIYSTVRGGVKFVTEPDEALELLPSHRVNSNSNYGARDGIARNYEVTEEPDEQSFKYLQTTKAFPARAIKVERHRLTQEEHGLYSSTYVPEPSLPNSQQSPITTTVWNAVPSFSTPENVELSSSISPEVLTTTVEPPSLAPQRAQIGSAGRNLRGRARPSAPIPEDIFQGRGERRNRPEGPTQQEVQRNRQRSNVRAPKRYETAALDSQITVVNKYSAEPAEAVPTEEIPTRPQNSRKQNRRPPALAGDKPAVKNVGNSIAPRRQGRPKLANAQPAPQQVPQIATDAPEKLTLPIADMPFKNFRPTETPSYIPLADASAATDRPVLEILTMEPVARLPETTTNFLTSSPAEEPSTTSTATVASGGRQRARGSRPRGRGASETATPRQRSQESSRADPADGEERSSRRVNRRGKQRSRSGSNSDANNNAAVTLTAPESTESVNTAARPRVPNQRSHATSPTAADHHQEPSLSTRYRFPYFLFHKIYYEEIHVLSIINRCYKTINLILHEACVA